eukprot:2296028-Amphidinium_carterae.1
MGLFASEVGHAIDDTVALTDEALHACNRVVWCDSHGLAAWLSFAAAKEICSCLLYTSDAADDTPC